MILRADRIAALLDEGKGLVPDPLVITPTPDLDVCRTFETGLRNDVVRVVANLQHDNFEGFVCDANTKFVGTRQRRNRVFVKEFRVIIRPRRSCDEVC